MPTSRVPGDGSVLVASERTMQFTKRSGPNWRLWHDKSEYQPTPRALLPVPRALGKDSMKLFCYGILTREELERAGRRTGRLSRAGHLATLCMTATAAYLCQPEIAVTARPQPRRGRTDSSYNPAFPSDMTLEGRPCSIRYSACSHASAPALRSMISSATPSALTSTGNRRKKPSPCVSP